MQNSIAARVPSSFDWESHLIQKGCLTPKAVCASWQRLGEPAAMGVTEDALDQLERMLDDPTCIIVAANLPFDLGVACAERPRLIGKIFRALAEGRCSDTHIRQALLDIAEGLLFVDRLTNAPLGRYSVEYEAKLYLGLDLSFDKNDPRSWRRRYGELDGLPLSAYPEDAKRYSLGDAEHELSIWLGQEGGPNLQREPDEVRAAFSLHLMAMRGLRTDPVSVAALKKDLVERYEKNCREFVAAGLYKVVTCKLKPLKEGQDPTQREREQPDRITSEILDLAPPGSPWLKAARNALAAGKDQRFGEDSKKLEELVVASYKGDPPRSEKGNVKCDRDTLDESGDELLERYGDSTNVVKLLKTYIPILESGTQVPINCSWNVLVDSLRTSCSNPNWQNLPR